MRAFFHIVFTLFAGIFPIYLQASPIVVSEKTKEVKWHKMDDVLALATKNPKKIFIDVYTDWCGYCKIMDKQTFAHPTIAAYLNDHFYPVKFNAEQKETILFGEREYKFMAEYRSNELAIALLQGKMSYPSIVYMDEKGQLLTIVPGVQQPDGLLPILVFFAEDYYVQMPWDDFLKNIWPAKQKEVQQ